MALSAFEALQEMKKKGNTAVPGGSQPPVSVPAPTGKKSAFEALQEMKKKPQAKAASAEKPIAPAPVAPPVKGDASLLMAPKSSASVITPAPLSNVSVAADDSVVKTFLDPNAEKVKIVGNLVHDYVKKMKSNATGPLERGGLAVVDTAIETAKDTFYRRPKTFLQSEGAGEGALTALDAGLNIRTLGVIDFVTGAAPELFGAFAEAVTQKIPGAKESGLSSMVGSRVTKGGQIGMEVIFNQILSEGVGGKVADIYGGGKEMLGFEGVTDVERRAIQNITTLGLMIGGFKAAGKVGDIRAERIANARSASELAGPLAQSIGMELKFDRNGKAIPPSEAQIIAAHKATLDKAATKNGPFMRAEMDAADAAREMLMDYRKLSPAQFDATWRESFEKGMDLSDRLVDQAETAKFEADIAEQGDLVNDVLHTPATKKTKKIAQNLSEAGQLAFEQELVDMAAKNDPKLQKQAAKDGLSYERVDAPDDARPGVFDALTNKITLNETAIRKTLDRVWGGEVLKVGEGKTTTIFRKGANETFEALKTRYERTIIDHELAHAKTVSPEDVARLRAAVADGDASKINRIRVELEDKANEYSFQKANDLDNKTNAEIDAAVETISQSVKMREDIDKLKFSDASEEAWYAAWRRSVRRGTEAPNPPEKFKNRFAAERSILDKTKVAREATQRKVRGSMRDPAVNRAVKAELRAYRRGDVLERDLSKTKSSLLKERVVRRTESDIASNKLAHTKAAATENLTSTKKKFDSKLLKERIVRRLEQSVLKEKAAKVQDEMRAKFKSRSDAQQILKDHMVENRVPNIVRGKFIAQLKNARSPEQAVQIIKDIDSEYNKFSREKVAKKIVDLLDKTKMKRGKTGKNEGKMTAEAQADLDFVRKIAKEDRNTLNQQIVELEAEARAKMAKEGNFGLYLPDDVARKIELLELGGVGKQSLSQLNRTLAVIEEMRGEGRAERAEYLERRQDAVNKFIASASTELIGTPKRQKTVGGPDQAASTEGTAREIYNSSSVLDDLTRDLGGVFETAGRELSSAQHKVDRMATDDAKAMTDRIENAYGKDWESEVAELANRKHDLGKAHDLNGVELPVSLTRGEAMFLRMKLREAGTYEAITSKDGLAYSPEIISKADSILTKADRDIADWIQDSGYAAEFKRLAPAYELREGVPLGFTQKYAGANHYTKGATAGGETTISLIADMMDAAKSNRLAATPGFTKSRVQGNLGQLKLSTNPILDFLVYQKRVNQYVEVGESVQKWNSLLADDGIRASIKEKRGKSFLDALEYQVKNIERGGLDTKTEGLSKAMDALGGNITAALLASPKVWAGQFSSLAGVRAEAALLPGKQTDFYRGVANTGKNTADVLQYSNVVSSRLGKTPSELLSKFSGEKGKFRRGIDKVKEFMGKPLEKADAFTTLRAASGIFEMQKNHYLDKGFNIEKAKTLAGRDVDSIITRTQSTRNFIGKSQLETGYLKYFVQLKQQPTKIFRGNIEAGKLWRRGRISGKQYASYLLWNNVIQGAAYAGFRSVPGALQLKGAIFAYKAIGNARLAEEKERDMKERYSAKGLAADAAFNGVTNAISFPIIGDVIQTLIQNSVRGKNYEFRPSIMTALTEDLFEAFQDISLGKLDEKSLVAIRAISRGIGLGDPAGLIPLILDAVKATNKKDADIESKTPAAKAQAKTRAQAAKTEKARREARIRQIESE